MKSLRQFIKESSQDEINFHPKNRMELLDTIAKLWKQAGNRADYNSIDTSEITDMSEIFSARVWYYEMGMRTVCKKFNSDISKWDTSKVTTMYRMFDGAISFDRDISDWNVSNVENFSAMFCDARSFNKDLNKWDTSAAKDMSHMFQLTDRFNGHIEKWDVSGVENMTAMFGGAISFNRDISGWDTRSLKKVTGMFFQAKSFNQDISGWNTSKFEEDLDGEDVFVESGLSKFPEKQFKS